MKKYRLGEWLQIWYNTYKAPYLKPYSLRNIEQMIRLHIPAWLKEKRMIEITVFDVDKALTAVLNGRTRVYARQVLHSAYVKACKLGIAERNILEFTDNVAYKKQKGKALTIAEQTDFLKALSGSRLQWLYMFYLYSGVRRTEALTLRWEDIDEAEQTILIRGTKTEESYRYILLSEPLKHILEQQRKQNEADKTRKHLGTLHKAEPWQVFPFKPEHVSREFKRYCPNHRLHDLRHTYITRCAESGVNIKVCQQLVGHSSIDTTMNIYTHVLDEFKRKEALKFTIFPKMT